MHRRPDISHALHIRRLRVIGRSASVGPPVIAPRRWPRRPMAFVLPGLFPLASACRRALFHERTQL